MSDVTLETLEILAPSAPREDAGLETALDRVVGGATFLELKGRAASAVWGTADRILWSAGEPCYLAGRQGLGKSTIAQQLVLARAGIRPATFLDLDVVPDARPVLYFASDRASQVARSLARMVTDADLAALESRVRVFSGPPTFDVRSDPRMILRLADALGVGTVVIDSAKDLAPDLENSETGATFNAAMQHLCEAGVDVLVLHHVRKSHAQNKKPRSIDDVFGSTWLTAGAGSVLMLWGEPGDPLVEMLHLKMPMEQVGPLRLAHDHTAGTTTLAEPHVKALDVLRRSRAGMTARDLAAHRTEGRDPRPADVERARRELDRLVADRLAHRTDGDKARSVPTVYVAAVQE
jgi:replicative DNA helicase